MIRLFLIIILSINAQLVLSQGTFFQPSDTLHKGRITGVSVGIGTVWAGSFIGLSQIWYSNVDKSSFHTFDDSQNWLQMDKAGHFYTAHKINQLCTDLFQWSGLDARNSTLIGTGVSLGYQTTLELFDGFSKEWGFSWSDMAANIAGSGSFLAQKLVWGEERIIPKFSYFPSQFSSIRPDVLGSSFTESLFKDYNGQTYWLSFSPGTFFKNSAIPKWACFSIGYSVHNKLVGSSETYFDAETNAHYQSEREFILSLDIDFSQIPIKRPWLKAILKQFNYLKIPFPAVVFRGSTTYGRWMYF